jgi:hypothetical protein
MQKRLGIIPDHYHFCTLIPLSHTHHIFCNFQMIGQKCLRGHPLRCLLLVELSFLLCLLRLTPGHALTCYDCRGSVGYIFKTKSFSCSLWFSKQNLSIAVCGFQTPHLFTVGGDFSGLQAFGQILYTHHKETGDDYANGFMIFRAGTTSCIINIIYKYIMNLRRVPLHVFFN